MLKYDLFRPALKERMKRVQLWMSKKNKKSSFYKNKENLRSMTLMLIKC